MAAKNDFIPQGIERYVVLNSKGQIITVSEKQFSTGNYTLVGYIDNKGEMVEVSENHSAQTVELTSNDADETPSLDNSLLPDDVGDIIAAIEQGNDPTQFEDVAPAAGESLSSSIAGAATVEFNNPEAEVSTFFETGAQETPTLSQTEQLETNFTTNASPLSFSDIIELSEDENISTNVPTAIDGDGSISSYQLVDNVSKGVLTFNPDGTYSFDTNGEFDSLAEGESETQIFSYISIDDQGATSDPVTITIIVNGVNDAANIGGIDSGEVVEDESVPFLIETGQLTITDVDGSNEALFAPDSVTSSQGTLGTLTISENGQWEYQVDNNLVQYLDEGETKLETFTVQSIDGTQHTVNVTIVGVNDSAVIGGTGVDGLDTGQVVEDESTPLLLESGTLTISDADGSDQESFRTDSVVAEPDVLGSLTIDANGNWNYQVDNSLVQYLDEGETKLETFTVQSEDGTQHTITVTIVGVNDSAVIAGVDTGTVTEDQSDPLLSDSGTLTIVDSDGSAQEGFDPNNIIPDQNALGTLSIDTNGNWNYSVPNADVQYLDEGETKVETFIVSTLDGTQHTITVTIIGVNDTAIIGGIDTGTVTEDESNPLLTESGTLTITDADGQEQEAFDPNSVVPGQGNLGSLTINANGKWDYQVANADVQFLGEGETKVETFTVQSVDGSQHSITVTIIGVNDSAIISGDDIGTVVEDTSTPLLTDNGSLRASDVDTNNSGLFNINSVSAVGAVLGSLSINELGDWQYQVDNALVQYLGEGETKTEQFTVQTDDGTEQVITITITGVNDGAIITGDAIGAVTEDESNPLLTDFGKLAVTDVDQGQAVFDPNGITSAPGTLGTLTIDPQGNWNYQVNNADVQFLGEGETKLETFTVTSIDGTEHTVEITITGVNDSAVIGGDDIGQVIEDSASPTLRDTGLLTINDVDGFDEESFDPSSVATNPSNLGALTITAAGQWVYEVDNSLVQYLGKDEQKIETFTVNSLDGTQHTVTVTIIGVNDDAIIGGVDFGEVTEDESTPFLQVGDTLTISDPDGADEAKFDPSTIVPPANALGTLTISENGSWSYSVANDDVQYLKSGESKTEIFTVSTIDGTEHQITITINGQDDPAIITGDVDVQLLETDAILTDSGKLTVQDVDGPNEFQVVTNQAGSYGVFNIDKDGNWTYVTNDAFNNLNTDSVPLVDQFVVKAADGTEQTITMTISGTNDLPELVADVGKITEDGIRDPNTNTETGYIIDALANDSDVDDTVLNITNAQVVSVNGDPNNLLGSVSVVNNQLVFFTNDEFEYLNDNESATVVINYQVTDDHGGVSQSTVTITVNGVNDPAIIGGDDTKVLSETDAPLQTSGKLNVSDVDNTDEFVPQTGYVGKYGTFSIDAQGNWTFVADEAYDYLNVNSTPLVSDFIVKSVDGTEHTIQVTIQGTNDAPVAFNSTENIDENDVLSSSVPTASDVDGTITAYQLVDDVPSGQGTLSLNQDGTFTFDTGSDFDYLAQGQQTSVSFTYIAIDNNGTASEVKTVTINITGENDSPSQITGSLIGNVEEDGTQLANGQLAVVDADQGASHTWSALGQTDSTYGDFGITADGFWTYNLDNDKAQELAKGQIITERFVVQADDGLGGTISQTVTVTITGENDEPTITNITTNNNVEEDNALANMVTGDLGVTDVDLQDGHTWSIDGQEATSGTAASINATFGTITLDSNGVWKYTLDDTKVDFLASYETREETFTIKVDDGNGGTDEFDLVVTIKGSNDVPDISGTLTQTVAEDASQLTVSGNLSDSDPDLSNTHSWSLVDPSSASGDYGLFSIDPTTGTWSYTLDNDKAQELAAGAVVEERFTIQVNDNDGGIDTEVIVVRVTGTNDDPVIDTTLSTATDDLVEDVTVTGGGTLIANDIDTELTPDTLTWSIKNSDQGLFGTASIDNNGNWVYNLDPALSNRMEEGKNYQDTFTAVVSDGNGGTDEIPIVVNIVGSNDAPEITGRTSRTLTEDVEAFRRGRLYDNDPDDNKDITWTIDGAEGKYGTLTIADNGRWTYTPSTTQSQDDALQALSEGEVGTLETFTVHATDQFGATDNVTVTITVVGTNDQPSIVVNEQLNGSVTEDTPDPSQPITTTGDLSVTDVDTLDTHTWSLNSDQGKFGTISIDNDGKWTYVLNNSNSTVQGLLPNESLTDTFTVTVKDNNGSSSTTETITITIHGDNDTPSLSGDTGSVVENTDNRDSAQGQLVVSDIDVNDSHTWDVLDTDPTGGPAGKYGTLTVDQNGKWSYLLDNDKFETQQIPPGETRQDIFQVEVEDLNGATAIIDVVINVAGVNNPPDIIITDTYTIKEDAIPDTITGTINSGDPDDGESLTWSIVGSTGQYGTLTFIDPTTGEFSYKLDNSNPAVNALTDEDIAGLQDVITIRVVDQYGQSSTKDLTINIDGTNDAPNLSGNLSPHTTEDTITTTGNLSSGDPDAGDTHTFSVDNGAGSYGSFSIDSVTGKWTYILDTTQVQQLNPNQSYQETFNVTVIDSKGEASTKPITITIDGVNDSPTITGDLSATFVEDSTDLVTGKLNLIDIDDGDSPTFNVISESTPSQGNYGTFSIDAQGNWKFIPNDSAINSLEQGAIVTETFNVIGKDSFGAVITDQVVITINGENDPPIISGDNTGYIVEDDAGRNDGSLSITEGQLTSTDVDDNSSISGWSIDSSQSTGLGTYGQFTITDDGKWTYQVVGNAIQDLDPGQVVTEEFWVIGTDDKGENSQPYKVTVFVHGWDDDAAGGGGGNPPDRIVDITEGDETAGPTESVEIPVGGGLNNSATATPHSGGAYGELVYDDSAKKWFYVIDNNNPLVDGLQEGETITEVWHISNNGVTFTVEVTIKGVNDAPQISYQPISISEPDVIGEVTEDVTLSSSGVLEDNDPDFNDSQDWVIVDTSNGNNEVTQLQGDYGTLTLNPDTGEWEYNIDNNAVQPLNAGDVEYDTFTVKVTDEKGDSDTQEIKIKVNGSADDITVDPDVILELDATEDQNNTFNQSGNLTPPNELGSNPTWQLVDGSGTYGSITINPDGSYEYTLDNNSSAVQSLREGETVTDTFTVFVTDQYGKTVVDENGNPIPLKIEVEVTGTNDKPVISGATTGSVSADSTSNITGQLASGDVDAGDTATWNPLTTVNGQYGTFTLNSNGKWTYDLNENHPDIIALNPNETLTESFPVSVTDSANTNDSTNVVITIKGTNQSPEITGDVTGEVQEDIKVTTGELQLTSNDVDNADSVTFAPKDLSGTYGQFVLGSDGKWSYTLYSDPHVQALPEGAIVTESFFVTATDSFGAEVTQEVTVTILGNNDLPTIQGTTTGTVTEDSPTLATGNLGANDVDFGDVLSYQVVNSGAFGSNVTIDGNTWKYELNSAHPDINALPKGGTTTDTISIIATDGNGNSVPLDITITINGTNDAPEIASIATQTVAEDDTSPLTGTFDSGDPDIGDVIAWTVIDSDSRGTLTIDSPSGDWKFTYDNNLPEVQALAVGESLTLQYEIQAKDEHGLEDTQIVTFEITGTNDLPEVTQSSVTTGQVFEDPSQGSGTATGNIDIDDVDTSDNHLFTFDNNAGSQTKQGQYGELTIDKNTGAWTYIMTPALVESLTDTDQNIFDTFTVTIDDENGGVITQDVVIQVFGDNDAPFVVDNQTDTSGEVTEDGTTSEQSATGTITADDAENQDLTFSLTSNQSQYGTFSVNNDGEWDYVLDPVKSQALPAGITTEQFVVLIEDTEGKSVNQTITITLNGNDDSPIIENTSVISGSVTENGTALEQQASGKVEASDPEGGAVTFELNSPASPYGSFILQPNGEWTYILDPVLSQALPGGITEEVFTVVVKDGSANETNQLITITLNGNNDPATVDGVAAGQVKAGFVDQASGLLTVDDVDTDASNLIWSVDDTSGSYGALSFDDSTLTWTYTLTPGATDTLSAGQTFDELFTINVSDGTTITPKQVTVTVLGTAHIGSLGSDILVASSYDEILWGGPTDGSDIGTSDTFLWSDNVLGNSTTPGDDIIKDFDVNADVIDLEQVFNLTDVWDSTTLSNELTITEINGNAVLQITQTDSQLLQSITLDGVSLSNLYGQNVDSLSNQERVSSLVETGQLVVSKTFGHEGNDTLSGTSGNDILTSGGGIDSFVFLQENSGSTNTITDYDPSGDEIDLTDLLPANTSVSDLLDANLIQVTVNDDPTLPDSSASSSTTITVEDTNGAVTNITLEGIGWDTLNVNSVSDVSSITTESLLSTLHVLTEHN
ncbi:VCBS domain-containing protein [Vibrio rotiferianus]|uniref:VCBS domain-containing protein n=1 Tax=Vibrio rotiferianus TaxID=190895 RepID=UPI00406A3685